MNRLVVSRYIIQAVDDMQVFGMNGMLVSENQRPTELTSYSAQGSSHDTLKHSFPERYFDSYVNALNTFLDVLEGTRTGNQWFMSDNCAV